jgi:8-oxo-dGTP pyrophosphatase MutT (NUDIX family)
MSYGHNTAFIERLQAELDRVEPARCAARDGRATAVLLPLYREENDYHLIFIQRSAAVKQHSGQISFPGGHCEPDDADHSATALRECVEEIGVRGAITLLGQLDDVPTLTSNYIISPFVGLIAWPQPLTADPREVAGIFAVPLADLLACPCLGDETIVAGHPMTLFSYTVGNRVIWGATARILRQFLEIYRRALAAPAA